MDTGERGGEGEMYGESNMDSQNQFSSVQSFSHVQLYDPMNRSTPGLPVQHQLPESLRLTFIELVMPSSHLILCCPLLLLAQSLPASESFQWVSSLHEVARVLEFQLYHHSFQRNPMADSFRMDWLDFLAVQGTLKSLRQHHSSKASSKFSRSLDSDTHDSLDFPKNSSPD